MYNITFFSGYRGDYDSYQLWSIIFDEIEIFKMTNEDEDNSSIEHDIYCMIHFWSTYHCSAKIRDCDKIFDKIQFIFNNEKINIMITILMRKWSWHKYGVTTMKSHSFCLRKLTSKQITIIFSYQWNVESSIVSRNLVRWTYFFSSQ